MKSRIRNSQVRVSTLETLNHFIDDLATHHPFHKKEFLRDKQKICKRFNAEGVEFLTCTLPSLGKALIQALTQEVFTMPYGFRKKKGTQLPLIFNGLWLQVFYEDGNLREQFDHSALVDLFQITFLFYKLELPYKASKKAKVINSFIETEKDLSELTIKVDDPVLFDAQDLIEKYFCKFNYKDITPHHGPGAVATGEKDADKWDIKRKYSNIHKVYPYYEYFVPSRLSLFNRIKAYKDLIPLESGCAKVTLVPKDSRGPRLISMEPLEYQYIQQGLKDKLYEFIEKKCPFTRGFVNFTDQMINRNLAYNSSLTGEYCTLDMKEASDRVSLQLVELLFAKTPGLLAAFKAVRTTHTMLPNGDILKLFKFAPMGSALCFPVEALVFFVLAKAIQRYYRLKGKVFVYGDDIIVPKDLALRLFELFPKYGLKFNIDKSFTNGSFRESCGMDAYKGIICTPIRMKHLLPSSMKYAAAVVASVSLSNSLFAKGYWKTADFISKSLPLDIRVLNAIGRKSSYLCYETFCLKTNGFATNRTKFRYCKDYQRLEFKAYQFHEKLKSLDFIDVYHRLHARVLGDSTVVKPVPQAGSLKLRWLSPYGR